MVLDCLALSSQAGNTPLPFLSSVARFSLFLTVLFFAKLITSFNESVNQFLNLRRLHED